MPKKRLLWISHIKVITSVNINWFNSEKYFFTDESVKNIFFTGEWVNKQITDSISENLIDSDLESKNNNNSNTIIDFYSRLLVLTFMPTKISSSVLICQFR